jgi:hypothetical protein
MSIPDRTVTKVSWKDLFPWLCLLRTFAIAGSVTVVAFAALATVLSPIGWIVSEKVFLNKQTIQSDPEFQEFVEINRSPYRGIFDESLKPGNYVELFGARLSGARAVFERTTFPYRMLFRGGLGARKFFYVLFGCAWMLVAWSFSGCCITRYALLRMTRDETLPIDEVWEFGVKRFFNCVLSVLACFGVVVLFCLPCFLIGLFLTTNATSILGALLWVIVSICGVGIALSLFGLLFGWPLMIASVSAENQNALDAVTRSFAYVYQKPLNYAFYALMALIYGGFCWLIISYIANMAINASFWAASWGTNIGNPDRIAEFMAVSEPELVPVVDAVAAGGDSSKEATSSALNFSAKVIRFWNGMISTLAVSFLNGLFWCLAAGIYLLMRWDVDETEMDEVFLDEDSRTFQLPPLKSDENGIPQIQKLEDYEASRQKSESSGVDALGE